MMPAIVAAAAPAAATGPVGWAAIGLGAALSLGGLFGGSKQKGATQINIKYPEKSEVENEIDKSRLRDIQQMWDKTQNSAAIKDMLGLLSPEKMLQETRARYANLTNQVAKFDSDIASKAIGSAMGESLKDAVGRGAITPEMADRQMATTKLRMDTMIDALLKKQTANIMATQRGDELSKQLAAMKSAGTIGSSFTAEQNILNDLMAATYGNMSKRSELATNQLLQAQRANLATSVDTSNIQSDFGLNAALNLTKTAGNVMSQYQQNQYLNQLSPKDQAYVRALNLGR